MRRERDEQQSNPNVPPASSSAGENNNTDNMEVLFRELSVTVNQWAREQQQQQQSSSSSSSLIVSQEDRKRLMTMFNMFMRESFENTLPNDEQQAEGDDDQSATAGQQQKDKSKYKELPTEDFFLTKIMMELDLTIDKVRSYLRKVMMNRLSKRDIVHQRRSKSSSNNNNKMLLECDKSSSNTTAGSDNNKNNSIGLQDSASSARTVVANNQQQQQQQQPTFEADAFLFDDEDIDDFEERGWLSRHFCKRCGKCDAIDKTAFISHSFSPEGLKFLCCVLLEKVLEQTDKVMKKQKNSENETSLVNTTTTTTTTIVDNFSVVDVGSRLGIVPVAVNRALHAKKHIVENDPDFHKLQQSSASASASAPDALAFSSYAPPRFTVHGVEIDKDYSAIQQKLFSNTRVVGGHDQQQSTLKLHANEDITSETGIALLRDANLIVMNNVFEFFSEDPLKELELWKKVLAGVTATTTSSNNEEQKDRSSTTPTTGRSCVPKFIVMVPSLNESLDALEKKLQNHDPKFDEKQECVDLMLFRQQISSQLSIVDDITKKQKMKFAKYCIGKWNNDDDDDDFGNNCCGDDNCNEGGCGGGGGGEAGGSSDDDGDDAGNKKNSKKKDNDDEDQEKLDELLEDFSEMTLYSIND